jgi:polyhydroxyalkanoate synthase
MDDDQFVENYFAMEKWTNDNIPVAGETFREFVTKLYQRNELVKGEFRLAPGEEPVQLSRITCPLMLLTASSDHLVPPAQTEGIVPHVGTKDVKSMTLNAGHIGLAVSTKAHKTFWPDATRWIADRSTAR